MYSVWNTHMWSAWKYRTSKPAEIIQHWLLLRVPMKQWSVTCYWILSHNYYQQYLAVNYIFSSISELVCTLAVTESISPPRWLRLSVPSPRWSGSRSATLKDLDHLNFGVHCWNIGWMTHEIVTVSYCSKCSLEMGLLWQLTCVCDLDFLLQEGNCSSLKAN